MDTLAHNFKLWEDVLAELRRVSVCWRGDPLSDRDLRTYTEAIVLCALHLTDLSTQHDGIGETRDIIRWAKNIVRLDVSDVGTFLSDAIVLLRHVATPTSYSWFKRQLLGRHPYTGDVLQPIHGALSKFLAQPDPRGFSVCYQFLSFLTHLSLQDVSLDIEDEYEEMESYLRSLHYEPGLLRKLNKIMREWMSDFSISEESFYPAHGPGATAELAAVRPPLEKYLYLGTDPLLDYVLRKQVGVVASSYLPHEPCKLTRQAKIVSVPKSMKTRRTISKEPAGLMYFQQAVSSALVDYIHQHPYLSRHIDLREQELNAELAIRSSRTQEFATVDLSSASDTVTTTLAKAVFYGTPVYPYLVALRSTTAVLPSGKAIPVEKLAPMGSALCFPIETLVFSACIEYAVRRSAATLGGYLPEWRAYGDDLIVQDPLFEDLVMVLEAIGFIVNSSKSYNSPYRFRESCGGEGYDGVRVTPLKISRRFASIRGRIGTRRASEFTGLIELANACYAHHLPLVRAWIIRVLLDNPIAPPLFSERGEGAIYSPVPDNYRARRRWNSQLQRREICVLVGLSRPKKTADDSSSDQDRYFETLRQTHMRDGDMFRPEHRVEVPGGSVQSRLVKIWVPDDSLGWNCATSPRLKGSLLSSLVRSQVQGELQALPPVPYELIGYEKSLIAESAWRIGS